MTKTSMAVMSALVFLCAGSGVAMAEEESEEPDAIPVET
jgi:hypothetical protein